jgi:hypothetical protein
VISPEQLEQMRSAFNGLSGRLAIQKKLAEIAQERLEEEERLRDELEAACAALAVAIQFAEESQKQEPAAATPSTAEACKRPRMRAKQKEVRP